MLAAAHQKCEEKCAASSACMPQYRVDPRERTLNQEMWLLRNCLASLCASCSVLDMTMGWGGWKKGYVDKKHGSQSQCTCGAGTMRRRHEQIYDAGVPHSQLFCSLLKRFHMFSSPPPRHCSSTSEEKHAAPSACTPPPHPDPPRTQVGPRNVASAPRRRHGHVRQKTASMGNTTGRAGTGQQKNERAANICSSTRATNILQTTKTIMQEHHWTRPRVS